MNVGFPGHHGGGIIAGAAGGYGLLNSLTRNAALMYDAYESFAREQSDRRGRQNSIQERTPPQTPQKRHRQEDKLSQSMKNKKSKTTAKKSKPARKSRKAASRPSKGGPGASDKSTIQLSQRKKSVEIKKKRIPRVTSMFKKKVEAALSPDKLKGTYHLLYMDQGLDLTTITEDQQVAFDSINNPTLDGGLLFSTDHFNEAIQRLWFNKTSAYALGFLSPVANGNYNNKKFRVIDSYSTFEYKNNSVRVVTLKIYECAPKRAGGNRIDAPYTTAQYDNTGAVVGAQKQIMYPPQKFWADALNQDFTLGYSSDGRGASCLNTEFGQVPTSSKTFNTMWKVECKQIRMLPGQVYKLKVQGPSQVELDYQKFNQDGIYNNVQKFTRGLLHVVSVDMTDLATAATARGQPAATTGSGPGTLHPFLSMERQDHFRFDMPDTLVATADRRDHYIRAYAYYGVVAGAAEEVTENNPITTTVG